jgi:hypothetical protein
MLILEICSEIAQYIESELERRFKIRQFLLGDPTIILII